MTFFLLIHKHPLTQASLDKTSYHFLCVTTQFTSTAKYFCTKTTSEASEHCLVQQQQHLLNLGLIVKIQPIAAKLPIADPVGICWNLPLSMEGSMIN